MDLVTYFEEKQQKMLDDLEELVNMDTPSRSKELVDLAIGQFVNKFRHGIEPTIEYYPNAQFGDAVKLTIGESEKQVLVLGHIDTVWPAGEVLRRPFRREGDVVYGPGVFDMKAGLIQGLYAMSAIRELATGPYQVCLILNADEELGSPTSRSIIEAEARHSTCVFVLEPALGGTGALKTARKGVGRFSMKITGVAAHSGIDHQNGTSAIEELALQIHDLHMLTDYKRGSTVNVGIVSGGSATNVVAGEAYAEIDLRVETMEEANRLSEVIQNIKPKLPQAEIQIQGRITRPPMQKSVSRRLFLQAQQTANELGFDLIEKSTGGASDGCFTAALGVETLDGLGAVGGGAHALNEHVNVNEIPRRTALLTQLLLKQFHT